MTTRTKRQATKATIRKPSSPQLMPVAPIQGQIEAYLLARDVIRRIQRTATLFPEVLLRSAATRDFATAVRRP